MPASQGPVLVCGLGHVGWRIAELLARAGVPVSVLTERGRAEWLNAAQARGITVHRGDARHDGHLMEAGLAEARAVVIAPDNDPASLEIALDVRRLRPDTPLVARIFDRALARHLEPTLGLRALAVSALAAPAFAAAALGQSRLAAFALEETPYVVGWLAPAAAALVEAHGGAALGQSRAERVTVVAPLAAWRELSGEPAPPPRRPRFPLAALADAWRGAPPALRHALIALWVLILLSVFVFRGALGLPLVDALYFVVTTVTTTGYGDYNLHDASAALKLFGIALMLVGSTTLALLYSLFTDLVVSARVRQLVGRQLVPASGHVVVVGVGNLGFRVVEELRHAGVAVAAVDRDGEAELTRSVGHEVAMVRGDGRVPDTLVRAGLARARAVVAVTGDDAANLGVAPLARKIQPGVRTVVRLFDGDFARKVESGLGIDAVLSASRTATPTFAAAALEPDVLAAFEHEGRLVTLAWHASAAAEGRLLLRRAPDGSLCATDAPGPGERVLVVTMRDLAQG